MFSVEITERIKEQMLQAQAFVAKTERFVDGNEFIGDYIRLEVSDGFIHMVTTNGVTQFFESSLECNEDSGRGEVVLQMQTFLSLIKKKKKVTLTCDNGEIRIQTNNTVISLPNVQITFPLIPCFDNNAESIVLPVGKLAEGFSKTNYAAYSGDDPSRAIYTGIKVTAADGMLTFVATDTSRIVCANIEAKTPKKPCDIVIPQWLSRFVCANKWENKDAPAIIVADSNHISITVGTISIISCRHLGVFCDMTSFIAEDRWWISVNKEEFRDIIQEVLVLHPVKMRKAGKTIFELSPNGLEIRSTQTAGSIHALLSYSEESDDIPEEYINAYNPMFILDAVNSLGQSEEILLGLSSRGKPLALMCKTDPDCLHIIAAVRFKNN